MLSVILCVKSNISRCIKKANWMSMVHEHRGFIVLGSDDIWSYWYLKHYFLPLVWNKTLLLSGRTLSLSQPHPPSALLLVHQPPLSTAKGAMSLPGSCCMAWNKWMIGSLLTQLQLESFRWNGCVPTLFLLKIIFKHKKDFPFKEGY